MHFRKSYADVQVFQIKLIKFIKLTMLVLKKVKVVDLYSTSTRSISKALRYSTPVSEMTYTVSSGTLNSSIPSGIARNIRG